MVPAKPAQKSVEPVDLAYDEATCTDRYDRDPAVLSTLAALESDAAFSLEKLRAAFAKVKNRK